MLSCHELVGDGDRTVWIDRSHVIAVEDEGPDAGNGRPIMCIVLDTGHEFHVYGEAKDY